MAMPIEAILFGLLLVTALVIVRLRNLFAAAMLTGLFSLLSAGLFMLMDGVDVAFTEAAVGAGISTVLFVGTLALTGDQEREGPVRLLPFVVVALVGAALLYGTSDMPSYGDPNAPIHQHVAPRYIEETPKRIAVPNIVTAVLASYRGYDTFGETVVILTAGIGVCMLLGRRRRRDEEDPSS